MRGFRSGTRRPRRSTSQRFAWTMFRAQSTSRPYVIGITMPVLLRNATTGLRYTRPVFRPT